MTSEAREGSVVEGPVGRARYFQPYPNKVQIRGELNQVVCEGDEEITNC